MNKLQTDSIIFDLDGTLWNSGATVMEAWYRALEESEEIEETITQEQINSVFGMQHDLIGAKLFPNLPRNKSEKLMEKLYGHENSLIKKIGGAIYRNVQKTLTELHPNYPLFIVSNCQSGYIEAFYEYHKLNHYFIDQECSGNTGLAKSQNIKAIITRNNLKHPIYVGDTQGDFEATQANKIPFIFAEYGFGDAPEAQYRIKDISELPSLLTKI